MKTKEDILSKIQALEESKKKLLEELNGINSSTLIKDVISVKAANDFILRRISEYNSKIEVLNWTVKE